MKQVFELITTKRRSRAISFYNKIVGYTRKSVFIFPDSENYYVTQSEFEKALVDFKPLTREITYYISFWNTKANTGRYANNGSNISHMTVVIFKWINGVPADVLFFNPHESGGTFLVSILDVSGIFVERKVYVEYGDQKDDEMTCAKECLKWVEDFLENPGRSCYFKFNKHKRVVEKCNKFDF